MRLDPAARLLSFDGVTDEPPEDMRAEMIKAAGQLADCCFAQRGKQISGSDCRSGTYHHICVNTSVQ
jgi:hypothetical protein